MKISTEVFLLALCLGLSSCAHGPLKDPRGAFRQATFSEARLDVDSSDLTTFHSSLAALVQRLSTREEGSFIYGPRTLAQKELREFYQKILSFKQLNKKDLIDWLHNNSEPYEIYGQKKWGEVFATGYFQPKMRASAKKTATESSALWGVPRDMVEIDANAFGLEKKRLRGRVVQSQEEGVLPVLVPYDDRAKWEGRLDKPSQLIAWVDPTDHFFLQIQGSGILEYADGRTEQVTYANQNGQPYFAIGNEVFKSWPQEQKNGEALESYVRKLDPVDREALFNKNPSYVFFRKTAGGAETALGLTPVELRTVAVDPMYVPLGSFLLLEYVHPLTGVTTSHWALAVDTGGAIKGPGRLDLYTGEGEGAKKLAQHMKGPMRVWAIVPKPERL